MSGPRETSVVVTGADGQVGRDLVATLMALTPFGSDPTFQPDGQPVVPGEFRITATTRRDLDVTRTDDVTQLLRRCRPDVVVNLAAYTAVDAAESDVESCERINRDAVGALSRACAEVACHFITLSTDYVFDGLKGSAYVESDDTHPLNVYGRAKRDGELACHEGDTIVRTSWVMGIHGRHAAKSVVDRASRGETSRFVTDRVGTPTLSADLARSLVTLVRQRPGGVWHITNTGCASWFDVAVAAISLAGEDTRLVLPITSEELDPAPPARRPPRSDLDNRAWREANFVPLPPWSVALGRLFANR